MDISQFTNLFQIYLTPDGVKELVAEIHSYQQQYGKKWLDEFKTDYPAFVEIIDLIANYDADIAFLKLHELAKNLVNEQTANQNFLVREGARQAIRLYIEQNRLPIFSLHGTLRAELDKPRF